MLLNCGVGEDSLESLGLQEDPTSPSYRKSTLNIHWKDWHWSWNSNPLATWCKESTHWKRPWCWERWKAGGEGVDTGWDGWMASPTQWTWIWANSRRQWRKGSLACCSPRGLRVGHDWAATPSSESTHAVANSRISFILMTTLLLHTGSSWLHVRSLAEVHGL